MYGAKHESIKMYCFMYLFNNILPFSLSFMSLSVRTNEWMDVLNRFVHKQCHVVELFYNKCVITACHIM